MATAEPPVLKYRHDLLGRKILPLITRLQGMVAPPPDWAQLKKGTPLADYTEAQLATEFVGLTGYVLEELLRSCAKDMSKDNAMLAVHCAIELANEIGQPRGQQLQQPAGNPQQQPAGEGERRGSRKRPADDSVNQMRGKTIYVHMHIL